MKNFFYLTIMGLLIASCDSLKEKAGFVKYQPDEYQVTTNPPLTVPPDFNIQSPEEIIAKKRSGEGSAADASFSQGESYILQGIKQK